MLPALGLADGQCRTRADDELGAMQLDAIARAVEDCRFTVLVASSATRGDRLARIAAALAEHVGWERGRGRLIVVARDFTPGGDGAPGWLPLTQRALVGLDCGDEERTAESLARLRALVALAEPEPGRPPPCPYPGLERFTASNRDLLFGRKADQQSVLQRVRAGHTRVIIVGPSGSGKSSLIHAAVLPELAVDHVVHVVPRGGALARTLRVTIDALDIPGLAEVLDQYAAAIRGAGDAEVAQARAVLRIAAVVGVQIRDGRRRVIVIDPLEEIFAEDDAAARETLFALLGGLWSLQWCTVIMAMRADFYGALMAERCWHELERHQYAVAPLDEAGLRAAIVEPALRAGVHIDPVLVERLLREIDRDRSSVPLPLLQVALKQLWAQLRWRYLELADYERIVNHDQRGLAAVLAVHADSVVQALTAPGDWAVAQRVLLDLVHLGEGRPHTRRRRTVAELRRSGDRPDQLERVVDQLIAGRLLTTGDGDPTDPRCEPAASGRHVDLAHDALITGWPALARWVVERRDDLRTQRRLEARAVAGGVLSASELPEFTRWIAWVATPAGHALGLAVASAVALVFWLQTQQLREEQARTEAKERERLTEERNDISHKHDLVTIDLDERARELAEVRGDLDKAHDTSTRNAVRADQTARAYFEAEEEWSDQRDLDRDNHRREQRDLSQQRDRERAAYQHARAALAKEREHDQASCQRAHDDLVEQRRRDQASCQRAHDDLVKRHERERTSLRHKLDDLERERDRDRTSCRRELQDVARQRRR